MEVLVLLTLCLPGLLLLLTLGEPWTVGTTSPRWREGPDPTPRVDWRSAAASLGLALVGPRAMEGLVGGRRVSVTGVSQQNAAGTTFTTKVEITLTGAGTGLSIGPRRGPSADPPMGDARFDLVATAGGPPTLRLALLDDETRRETIDLVRTARLTLGNGRLSAEVPGEPPATLTMVRAVLALAERLDPAVLDVDERLALNVRNGRFDALRRACLEQLAARAPSDPRTIEAAADLYADTAGDDRAMALEILGRGSEPEVLSRLLSEALASQSRACLLAALRLTREKHAVGLLGVVNDCARLPDELVACAAIETLGTFGDDASRAALVALTSRNEDVIQAAAARALGEIGTRAEVEALHALSQRLLEGGAVKEAARDAIRRIQARAGPADAGRLTVLEAAAEAGQLSVAAAPGELSLVDEAARPPAKVRG